jgi:hypothetical protein
MKKFNILFSATLLLLTFIVSCSKDKKLEINIQSKEGQWNIDNVTWTIVQQTNSGQVIANGTTNNPGTFTFDKDGSGSYSYQIDTIQRSGNFTWYVDDQKAILTSVNQTINFTGGATVTQKLVAYTGTQTDKNKLTLQGSETDQEAGSGVNQFVLTGTFQLSKK